MPYNTKKLKADQDKKPVPQYFNPDTDDYEPVYGRHGAFRTELVGQDGQPLDATAGRLEVNTRPTGLKDFAHGSVTVSSTPVELKAGQTPLPNRLQLIVYPPSSGTVYWGKNTVSQANGAPLSAGDPPVVFDFDPNKYVAIYAISDGTDRVVKVVEVR